MTRRIRRTLTAAVVLGAAVALAEQARTIVCPCGGCGTPR